MHHHAALANALIGGLVCLLLATGTSPIHGGVNAAVVHPQVAADDVTIQRDEAPRSFFILEGPVHTVPPPVERARGEDERARTGGADAGDATTRVATPYSFDADNPSARRPASPAIFILNESLRL